MLASNRLGVFGILLYGKTASRARFLLEEFVHDFGAGSKPQKAKKRSY